MTTTQFMVNGSNGEIEEVGTFFEAVAVKVAWMLADPTLKVTIDEFETNEPAHFNEDWLGWHDLVDWKLEAEADFMAASPRYLDSPGVGDPGWAEQIKYENACMGLTPEGFDYEPYGEDVDFAQADMLYRDAEASWYRFMVA